MTSTTTTITWTASTGGDKKEEEEEEEEEEVEEPTHLPGRFGGQGNQGMPHPLSSSSSSSLSSLPLDIFSHSKRRNVQASLHTALKQAHQIAQDDSLRIAKPV